MSYTIDPGAFNVLFDFDTSAGRRANLLVSCTEQWRVYAVESSHAALRSIVGDVSNDLRDLPTDPVRALARVVTLRVAVERRMTTTTKTTTTAAAGAATHGYDKLPLAPVPEFARQALPAAVAAMCDAGRPAFEIAERVRRVRQLLDVGKGDEAKRSIIADMFAYNVPRELHEALRVSTVDALSERRQLGGGLGAFGAGVNAALATAARGEPFASTGTAEGRARLETELMRCQTSQLARLGIEVRLAGAGTRRAPVSKGAPGLTQGRAMKLIYTNYVIACVMFLLLFTKSLFRQRLVPLECVAVWL